jgi:hypothetical protein
MSFDWQTIVVGLMILGALAYVGRRALTRIRPFIDSKATGSSCETECGKCETSPPQPASPLKTLVQLERSPTPTRRVP